MENGVANCVLATFVKWSIDMGCKGLWCPGRRLFDQYWGSEPRNAFVDAKVKGARIG